MNIRKFAMIGGIVMLAMGALALIPALSQNPMTALNVETSHGLFLGFIDMNIVNKIALMGFGIAGILASRADNVQPSVTYSKIVCVAMALLAVLGLIPQTNTLFGYWPLHGANVIVYAAFAALGGYFGYAVPAQVRHSKVVQA